MVHEYSWSNSGSVTEMRGRMNEIKNTAKKQVRHFAAKSGLTQEEAREVLRHEETWLTPQQAIKKGLIDGVLDFHPLSITPARYLKKTKKKESVKKK